MYLNTIDNQNKRKKQKNMTVNYESLKERLFKEC